MTEERRSHPRLALEQRCTLSGSGGEHRGTIVDLSAVGAKVVVAGRVAADREPCTLVIEREDAASTLANPAPGDGRRPSAFLSTLANPAPGDGRRPSAFLSRLSLAARVMFARERDGKMSFGIQFMDLDAAKHRALHAFLEGALGGDGGGSREHPRISHRVEVTLKTPDRARAALDNISRGGFGVVVNHDVNIGDALTVFLTVGRLATPLELPGAVVRAKPLDKGRQQVGVKLHALPAASQELLDKLLASLVSE